MNFKTIALRMMNLPFLKREHHFFASRRWRRQRRQLIKIRLEFIVRFLGAGVIR
jgi:hypothetical protein